MSDPLKNWQNGIPMEKLQAIENMYEKKHNTFSLSPFTEMNKPAIAQVLSEGKLVERGGVMAVLSYAKVDTAIKIFGREVSRKLKGSLSISDICYFTPLHLRQFLENQVKDLSIDLDGKPTQCFVYIWEEDTTAKDVLVGLLKFNKICSQFKSTGEIVGVYTNYIVPDKVPLYDKNVLTEIFEDHTFEKQCEAIASKINGVDFGKHYSNYSKGKVWTAVSIQGYSPDITFIEKPKEMLTSKKFAKDYGHTKDWELQKTELYYLLEEQLKDIIDVAFPGQSFDRIRLMKLDPGGVNKEIQRHTDQSDPDIGTNDGQIMRFHVPVVTNPNVKFSGWSYSGKQVTFNPKLGSMFVLDLRKPHAVVNEGDTTRVHLVFDVVMNEYMRKVIASGQLIG